MDFVALAGQLLSSQNVLALVSGSVLGLLFGLTPGLDATSGTALFVGFSAFMPTETAILFLMGLYTCATYAGSITAICVGIPGTPASAATCLDGHELTKQGKSGKALFTSLAASTFGGLVGTIALITFAWPLARVAVRAGPPEYFALSLLGLTAVGSLVNEQGIKGIAATLFGLLLTTIGIDPFTGYPRFTFGRTELFEGVSYIPALVGLFAISEALSMIEQRGSLAEPRVKARNDLLSKTEMRELTPVAVFSSILGTILGALPAIGAAAGNWICYNESRRIARRPQMFGKGSLEGVTAAESGNNATVSSSLIPLLTLSIPGSPTAAVLLGALMLHGVTPGPQFMLQNASMLHVIFGGILLANVVMFILGFFGIQLWTRLIQVPRQYLVAAIFVMSFIGSYGIRNNMFDVWLMLAFGIVGYLMRKAGFSVVPIVLSLVLGFLIQDNFRRSLIMSNNGYLVFVERPVTLILLVACLVSIGFTAWRGLLRSTEPRSLAGSTVVEKRHLEG